MLICIISCSVTKHIVIITTFRCVSCDFGVLALFICDGFMDADAVSLNGIIKAAVNLGLATANKCEALSSCGFVIADLVGVIGYNYIDG